MGTYRIASFNLHGLKESDAKEQDFEIIANIIKGIRPGKVHQIRSEDPDDHCFHLVAIQEAPDHEEFERFKRNYLGPGWDGVQVSPDGFSKYSSKGYAFVWNTAFFSLMPGEDLQKEKWFMPHILSSTEGNKIKVNLSEVEKLTRMPLYGRFRLKRCNMELRLLNAHLTFGRSNSMPDEFRQESDYKQRLEEYRILTQIVYPTVNRFHYNNGFQNYYTILMGDYNLNLDRDWTKGTRVLKSIEEKHPELFIGLSPVEITALRHALYEYLPKMTDEEYIPEEDLGFQKIVTVQDQLTTLTNKNGADYKIDAVINNLQKGGMSYIDDTEVGKMREIIGLAEQEFRVYKSNFDHMTYDANRLDDIIVTKPRRVDDIVTAYFQDETYDSYSLDRAADMYKKKVSDHLPIMVEISLNKH